MNRKNIKQILLKAALFFVITTTGQNKTLDSLRAETKKLTNSEAIVENYRTMINMFFGISMDSAAVYTQKLKDLSEKNDDDYALLYYNMASGLSNLYKPERDLEKAKPFFIEALKIANESGIAKWQAVAHGSYGVYYEYNNDLYNAFKYYKKSLAYSRKGTSKKNISLALQKISGIYYDIKNYEKALSYSLESYEISKEINLPRALPNDAFRIALYYYELQDYKNSVKYAKEAIHHSTTYSNYYLAYTYNIYAKNLMVKKEIDSAIFFFKKSKALGKQINNLRVLKLSNLGLGSAYMEKGNYNKALEHLLSAYEIKDNSNKTSTAKELVTLYKKLGDYKNALKYAEIYTDNSKTPNDKIFSLDYFNEQVDFELKELESIRERERLIARWKDIITFSVILIIIFTIAAFVFIKNNKKLKKAYEMVNLSNEYKSVFISKMSHEIKTPCSAIVGYTELLAATKLNMEQQNFVKTIYNSGNVLLRQFDDLLEVTALNKNKKELKLVTVDLQLLVRRIYEIDLIKAQEKGLEFYLEYDEAIKKNVKVDKTKLEQVLLNLVNNAIKYTNTGFVKLTAGLVNKTATHYTIKFIIEDTGIGIKSENLNKIFNEFYQEKTGSSQSFEGIGLGLSISQNILNLMDSKIHVTSKIGEGSEFSFIVSLEIGNAINVEDNIFKRNVKQNEQPFTILIAEDNKINMVLTVKIISEAFPNAIILEAYNGEEAVQIFDENEIDIILMDLQMPILNGYEAAKKIRTLEKTGKQVSIIGYSAGLSEIELANDIEFDSYIHKPIHKTEIMQKISSIIHRKTN